MFGGERRSIFICVSAAAYDRVTASTRVDFPRHAMQRTRQVSVVGIEEGQDLAAGEAKTFIDRFRGPVVALTYDTQVRVAGQHRGCLVGGHAVDNDMFEVGVILKEDAFDGMSEKLALVIRRRNNRDARERAHVHSWSAQWLGCIWAYSVTQGLR